MADRLLLQLSVYAAVLPGRRVVAWVLLKRMLLPAAVVCRGAQHCEICSQDQQWWLRGTLVLLLLEARWGLKCVCAVWLGVYYKVWKVFELLCPEIVWWHMSFSGSCMKASSGSY